MKLNFSARRVGEIETKLNKTIDDIIQDSSIQTLAYIISKTYVNDDDRIGCSLEVAYDKIDEFLKETKNGIQEITLLIIDELCNSGFFQKQ